MSKHPSNNTRQNLLRRGLAGILSLALLLGLLPSALVTARAASWADPYVQTLSDWGVMRGDINGNMNPDRSITRAEFVTLMNRAYGYARLGGNPFTDVRVQDWYYEDVDIAYNIGYFKGTSPTTASPNDSLTREQAAVLLARNMMLQPTVGETLGFSDTRSLSDWSRGLVGAAAANGIISGYEDGSFQPMKNITRGEVAAMLVRAIGTPVQTEGDHALGNVYGNVTVNTSGVKLRDGVIAGNLYLTGGIDLGEVLLENVTVLGEIIVSGGGESNSSESSIVLRNVVADNMVVDSISDQFVTIRAEGNTDIPTTTVRTNAYVDDSALPGYGLSYIELDGDGGTLLQLAGSVKEVWNRTPGSDLQVVQGSADKVTVDENAVGSSVLVDGDARVDDLNLDVATTVTGTGDIKNLNVGAAGSTVEQLPDDITIRPGITTDIAGSNMNSTQAAESSADPKLLAGYPAVRKIAPKSAELVFRTNKPGTVYWAVSAVADGSVSETDLLETPVYGNQIIASGKVTAAAANTSYTASVSKLTSGGSYYVTAMLVDGRDQRSPIKVTSFSTPDDTTPNFITAEITKRTCEDAQATVMTNKSCLLYYALLPKGAAAPTAADFKAASIPGNFGYGTRDVTKNTATSIHVNDSVLDEEAEYVLYLWLTDHDGAKSSSVVPRPFKTLDQTPPTVTYIQQTKEAVNSISVAYKIDEPGVLIWALVTEADHNSKRFLPWTEEVPLPNDTEHLTLKFKDDAALLAAKVWLQNAAGTVNSKTNTSSTPFSISVSKEYTDVTTSYVLYYMAYDKATATGNLSAEIKAYHVHTYDGTPPTVTQHFTDYDGDDDTQNPKTATGVRLVFSENVQSGTDKTMVFYNLYRDVQTARAALEKAPKNTQLQAAYEKARTTLGSELAKCVAMHKIESGKDTVVTPRTAENEKTLTDWTVDFRNARVKPLDDGKLEVLLPNAADLENASEPDSLGYRTSALNLASGATYYFHVGGTTAATGVYDLAPTPNKLQPLPLPRFTTSLAKVVLTDGSTRNIKNVYKSGSSGAYQALTAPADTTNDPRLVDLNFWMDPQDVESMDAAQCWDMLFWFDISVDFTLYSRPVDARGIPTGKDANGNAYTAETAEDAPWTLEYVQNPEANHLTTPQESLMSYIKAYRTPATAPANQGDYEQVKAMLTDSGDNYSERREYAIHLNSVDRLTNRGAWNKNVTLRVAVASATADRLDSLTTDILATKDTPITGEGVTCIEYNATKKPYYLTKLNGDQRLPGIRGTPNLSKRDDDSAEITLSLDQEGQVIYMAVPLSSLVNPNSPTGAYLGANELQESDLIKVKGTVVDDDGEVTARQKYSCPINFSVNPASVDPNAELWYPDLADIPLMAGDTKSVNGSATTQTKTIYQPDFYYFINKNTYKDEDKRIIKDRTGFSSDQLTIKLDDLDSNTVYLLFLMPAGRNYQPGLNDHPACYRFTTDMTDMPFLQLSDNGNPDILARDVSKKGDAYVSYFLVTKGFEAVDNSFTKLFSSIVTDKKDEFEASSYSNNASMTVLQAMATAYDPTGEYEGSVFDHYADANEKSTYWRLINASSDQGNRNNPEVVSSAIGRNQRIRPEYTLPFSANKAVLSNHEYTVVAMASRESNSTKADQFSYCAWYTVERPKSRPPMLDFVNVEAEQDTDTTTSKSKGLKSATVTLTFDNALYVWDGSTAYHVDNCGGSKGGHGTNPTPNSPWDTSKTPPARQTQYWSLRGLIADSTSTKILSGLSSSYAAVDHEAAAPATGNPWRSPINEITFKVDSMGTAGTLNLGFIGGKYSITDDGGVTGTTSDGKDRGAFRLSFRVTNIGDDDDPYYTLVPYGLTSGWGNDGWDSMFAQ